MESENNVNFTPINGSLSDGLIGNGIGGYSVPGITTSGFTAPRPWKFCPECAQKLEATWRYCAGCGNALQMAQPQWSYTVAYSGGVFVGPVTAYNTGGAGSAPDGSSS